MNILGRAVAPRVGQLDASLLDSELVDQLKDKLWDAFKVFHPSIKDNYEPELLLALRLVLFKATVWDHATTYGAKLQSLKFVHSRSSYAVHVPLSRTQKALYGLLTVGGGYLAAKFSEYLTAAAYDSEDMPAVVRMRALVDRLQAAWTAASLLNFLAFLYSGRYATLIMRLLRMRYMPVTRKVSRMVNYEFQNRQLVWNALTEFLLFVLPMINLGRLQRRVSRALWGRGPARANLMDFLPRKTCAICYEQEASNTDVTNPYVTNCGHVYSYVCIQLKLAEDPDGWPCLRCGESVRHIEPYGLKEPQSFAEKHPPTEPAVGFL